MSNLDNLYGKIKELSELYKDDQYLQQKLENYILNDLPNYLTNAKISLINREERKSQLQEAHNDFVAKFINSNKYFYNTTSEIFFSYDGENYNIIREDTIIHNALYHMRNKIELLPWKFKIKTSIIKNIREISILNSLPESATIQKVQKIFLNIFDTKKEVKYFLTVIGDIVLKKNIDININIISHNAKNILRTIENIGSQYFGHISITNSFKFKYHEHKYSECRIIITKPNEEVCDIIFKNIIDIIVVSCYYSNRFTNSDTYLDKIDDQELTNRILFLKNNTQETIVENFINSKIQASNNSVISMKNMLYLWKLYLDELKIPYIISQCNLKNLLKQSLSYDEENENFVDYTSNKIPFVSKFINFWDETIKEDQNEYYLEIEEIYILFKNYYGITNKNNDINENTIVNIIKHFYPEIIIDGNFITGISCTQWSKQSDIIKFLSKKYNDTINTPNCKKNTSLYELYNEYSRDYCKKNKNIIIINKNYFDLYVKDILSNFQLDNDFNIISISLFSNL